MTNFPASRLEAGPPDATFADASPALQTAFVEGTLNNLARANSITGEIGELLVCDLWWDPDAGFEEDEDDGGVDPGDPYFKRRRRSLAEILRAEVLRSEEEEKYPDAGDAHVRRDVVREPTKLMAKILARREGLESQVGSSNGTSSHETPELPDVNKILHLLEERADQTGAERQYWIESLTQPSWVPQDVTSSPYPNGDQGQQLLDINTDTHRYMIKSLGCVPSDYWLDINSSPSDTKKGWVCKSPSYPPGILSPGNIPAGKQIL